MISPANAARMKQTIIGRHGRSRLADDQRKLCRSRKQCHRWRTSRWHHFQQCQFGAQHQYWLGNDQWIHQLVGERDRGPPSRAHHQWRDRLVCPECWCQIRAGFRRGLEQQRLGRRIQRHADHSGSGCTRPPQRPVLYECPHRHQWRRRNPGQPCSGPRAHGFPDGSGRYPGPADAAPSAVSEAHGANRPSGPQTSQMPTACLSKKPACPAHRGQSVLIL